MEYRRYKRASKKDAGYHYPVSNSSKWNPYDVRSVDFSSYPIYMEEQESKLEKKLKKYCNYGNYLFNSSKYY